ncbi:hypothetical protein EPO33_04795 [Patescibacteria group bacterium]|nr:MAG: hypothetical protein EPO33_04795 [Patescibacteria group bacterium]
MNRMVVMGVLHETQRCSLLEAKEKAEALLAEAGLTTGGREISAVLRKVGLVDRIRNMSDLQAAIDLVRET